MARTQRPTNTWLCSNGVHLRVTALRIDQPRLASSWWPLHRVSRSAIHAGLPWPIHLDEFCIVGFHDRPRSPGIWVYVHTRTGAEIFVDGDGQTYRQTPLRDEPISGRFRPCDVRAAAERAGLHRPQARAQTQAAGLPVDAGFDPGQHLFEPRVLTPGRRVDAMRRSREIGCWDVQRPPTAGPEAGGPSGSPRSGPPPSYLTVLPGLPRTRDFTERWEPRVLMDSPGAQAALDAMEAAILEQHPQPSPAEKPPTSPPDRNTSPSRKARQSQPSGDQAPHPSRSNASPKPPRPGTDASVPRLRQVWPPPARPRRWSSS